MGPIWDRQDPGGPYVGPMNLAIWDAWLSVVCLHWQSAEVRHAICGFIAGQNLHLHKNADFGSNADPAESKQKVWLILIKDESMILWQLPSIL